jgi:hypothetical protein
MERWSDGRRVGSLFDNGYGIRACKCGKYYRLREAIDMGLLTVPREQEIEIDEQGKEISHIPAFLRRQVDDSIVDSVKNETKSFFQKLKSWFSSDEKNIVRRTKKIIVQEPLTGEVVDRIPNAILVRDSETYEIIKNENEYSSDLVLAARERYRMHLNDKYRGPFKDYCNDRSLPIPEYEISMEHHENTQATLDAYLESEKKNWREIGDLYRELGEFEKALESLCLESEREYNKLDLERITRACRMKVSNPLPL